MRRILLVDDDPTIRSMMRLMLEGAGYEAHEAAHGAIALRQIAQSLPDLVVTNIMMPVVDGIGLIRQLRANPATTALPILVISGLPDAEEVANEANAALEKPFVQDQLLAMVNSLIGAPDSSTK